MMRHYTFTHPITSSGKSTRYLSVLSFLSKSGPVSRYEILRNVWDIKNAVYHKEWYRGHMSSLFADMRRSGIVSYNRKTKTWSITQEGTNLLESAKSEWGKRYAENYWSK